jgi:arylsulfatase A-like enzyme
VHLKSVFLLLALLVFSANAHAQDLSQETSSPNVVMILVDDSALMDFGVYGGEAQTQYRRIGRARGDVYAIPYIAAVLADAGHAFNWT